MVYFVNKFMINYIFILKLLKNRTLFVNFYKPYKEIQLNNSFLVNILL